MATIQLTKQLKIKLIKALQDGFINTLDFNELFPLGELTTIEAIRKAFKFDEIEANLMTKEEALKINQYLEDNY
ncbi:hypothetical protein [Plebeiibacterium sediminum]|uniref:Uncharacterized protein n=1 Tax=Plebeiibacterium sediminum TaxID=2992112 RepID=A0AAE3M4F3_9BACT|nr:hypothetical protein [Plebeiobacterium sediminum]MCW3786833.1 hypothetical protein [Plebeiobacterium sediminum]